MRTALFARGPLTSAAAPYLTALSLLALPASAVTIDFVPVVAGDTPNACSSQPQGCYGDVAYSYQIAKYEVTNAQYAEFLNAVADADANALYNPNMATRNITQSGDSGSFSYAPVSGRADQPVTWVSFYDALRFANWLHNGQPTGAQGIGTTESGAYVLTGPTTASERSPVASIFLPSEDEWFKAAYYDAISLSYFDYPARDDALIACAAPPGGVNTANCNSAAASTLTNVGSYPLAPGPYGTFDQGGNVQEWNDAPEGGFPTTLPLTQVIRGGGYRDQANFLGANDRDAIDPAGELDDLGFRLGAPIPEPGTGLLVAAGMLGLVTWRRRR